MTRPLPQVRTDRIDRVAKRLQWVGGIVAALVLAPMTGAAVAWYVGPISALEPFVDPIRDAIFGTDRNRPPVTIVVTSVAPDPARRPSSATGSAPTGRSARAVGPGSFSAGPAPRATTLVVIASPPPAAVPTQSPTTGATTEPVHTGPTSNVTPTSSPAPSSAEPSEED